MQVLEAHISDNDNEQFEYDMENPNFGNDSIDDGDSDPVFCMSDFIPDSDNKVVIRADVASNIKLGDDVEVVEAGQYKAINAKDLCLDGMYFYSLSNGVVAYSKCPLRFIS